jgi:hypothetical protein
METVDNTPEQQTDERFSCLIYLPKNSKLKIPASSEKLHFKTLQYDPQAVDDETLNFKFLMPAIEVAKTEDYDVVLGFDTTQNRIIIGYKNLEQKYQAFNAHQQAAIISEQLIQKVIWDRPFGESGILMVKSIILSDQLDSIATKNGVPVKLSYAGQEELQKAVDNNKDNYEQIIAVDDRNTVILHKEEDQNPQALMDFFEGFVTFMAEKEKTVLGYHIELQTKYRLYLEKTFQINRDTGIKKLFDKFRTKPPEDDLADELILINDFKKQTFKNKLTGRKGTLEFEASNMVQLEYSSGLKITVEAHEGETQMSIHLSKYTNFAYQPKYAEVRKGLHDSLLKTVVILGKM